MTNEITHFKAYHSSNGSRKGKHKSKQEKCVRYCPNVGTDVGQVRLQHGQDAARADKAEHIIHQRQPD